MAQCFKRKESLTDAVRRLGTERMEHSLICLRTCRRADAVHCVRKDIKKVRALLRLVRQGISRRGFRELNARLRAAGEALSGSRDAYIKLQAVSGLTRHFKGQLAPQALRQLRDELRRDCSEALTRFRKMKIAPAVTRDVRRTLTALRRLRVAGDDADVLGRGLKRAYRRGRKAYRTARHHPVPGNFHAWRKRAKDLWYALRALQPIWPEELAAMAGELRTLGQSLGEDHDLTVLRRDVARCSLGKAREREILDGLAAKRQRELRRAALALGARWYVEKPARFRDRVMNYWAVWRGESTAV